ncbi:MAG TPA: RNA-binding protein [Thermoanaerobaculia bacterium]|jgi:heterogeneous nuclear ribonucleoprotein A1/A3|nr:RNA-binding protein [Thermoanaerobaculia bacterium]
MTRLYVGNLSARITDAQLHTLALPYGKPNSANIARELVGGASKGFAFIEYATAVEARAAIEGLDGKDVHGQKLSVCDANTLNVRPWSAAVRARG